MLKLFYPFALAYVELWVSACIPLQCSVKRETRVGETVHAAFKGK